MALRADDVDLGRDRDLVRRHQNGDPEAFDDLFRRYSPRLRRYCAKLTADPHEAEEIAQEAFVKAYGALGPLQGERRFYPWMTVIARRVLIDRHRRNARLELTADPDVGSVEPDHDHVFRAVDAEHVRAAMERLGPRHREVLVLRETEGMSYADIAESLEVPVTTVEALLHRARKALRREYSRLAGHGGLLVGLPVVGHLADRLRGVRARFDLRWAEAAGALAGPVAAGTAAVALAVLPATAPPAQTASPVPVATAAAADPVVAGEIPEPDPADLPATTPTTSAPATTTPPTPPTTVVSDGPTGHDIDLGPVTVDVGGGADAAGERATQLPVVVDLESIVAGLDPGATLDGLMSLPADLPTAPHAPGDAPAETPDTPEEWACLAVHPFDVGACVEG